MRFPLLTATRKIAEAEAVLTKMQSKPGDFVSLLGVFASTINDVFLHLLEEYNLKFDCKVDRMSLEKFKVKARRTGNIKAINFLIWYDKEYRKIRDGPFGKILERNYTPDYADRDGIINSCSALLNETRAMAYYAYENF